MQNESSGYIIVIVGAQQPLNDISQQHCTKKRLNKDRNCPVFVTAYTTCCRHTLIFNRCRASLQFPANITAVFSLIGLNSDADIYLSIYLYIYIQNLWFVIQSMINRRYQKFFLFIHISVSCLFIASSEGRHHFCLAGEEELGKCMS